VLVVEGLIKRFGGFTAVNKVSFKVDRGEILGLIGPNGSGKSTIFNMLSGTLAPTSGSMQFDGAEISGLAPHRIINRGIGRTFQIPRPFHRLTMFENVALAGYFGQGRHSRAKAEEAAERALAMVGLPADRTMGVDGLGAAGLKKLELAKALATGPKLLLADESLGGLDDTEMGQAAAMLRKIRDELGITETLRARPIQAAFASALSFAVGAAMPLLTSTFAPEKSLIMFVPGTSLLFLALLGALAAGAGGAGLAVGAIRVTFWGALAMGLTAGAGALFGTVV